MEGTGWEYQHGKLWHGFLDDQVVAEIEKSDVGRWRAQAFSSGWQDRFRTRKEARAWVDREIKRHMRALCRR